MAIDQNIYPLSSTEPVSSTNGYPQLNGDVWSLTKPLDSQYFPKKLEIKDHSIIYTYDLNEENNVTYYHDIIDHDGVDSAPFKMNMQNVIFGAANGDAWIAETGTTLRAANETDETSISTYEHSQKAPQFRGAMTKINPYDDPITSEMQAAMELPAGIESFEMLRNGDKTVKPPISPIHPFTRMNDEKHQYLAQSATLLTYNRTKIPIADNAFRKGFRYVFITRPECYIYSFGENGIVLSKQAENDEDFYSSNLRMPHILKLLSPVYVTGTIGSPVFRGAKTNWNYLLSNQVQGLSPSAMQMTTVDNVSKSIEGFTVTPAMHVQSRQGASINLTFKDTKNLEIFEYLKMWMLYAYKRKKGIFAPSFNGYQYENYFENGGTISANLMNGTWHGHPYDRALDYGATIFDIVTNETGSKILYWCKYYGIYPIEVSPSLSNDNNGPITDMTTQASFKYHYRLENNMKTLIEFNYNAGLLTNTGKTIDADILESVAFLLREDYEDIMLPNYLGASGMFTGSPYIVLEQSQPDPTNKSNPHLQTPYLRFSPIMDMTEDFEGMINEGMVGYVSRSNDSLVKASNNTTNSNSLTAEQQRFVNTVVG